IDSAAATRFFSLLFKLFFSVVEIGLACSCAESGERTGMTMAPAQSAAPVSRLRIIYRPCRLKGGSTRENYVRNWTTETCDIGALARKDPRPGPLFSLRCILRAVMR